MSPEQLPPDSDPDRPANRAAERLAVIVDAAERAALSVIDDAEQEARRYLVEAQARADQIVAARLREAADELDRGGGRDPEPRLRPVGPGQPPEPEVPTKDKGKPQKAEAVEEERDDPPLAGIAPPAPRRAHQGGAAAARLLATQMAVSGSSRKEIEMRLRAGFDIQDTGEILDAILGPEGD